MELLGVDFEVCSSNFVEVMADAIPPDQLAGQLAYGKAAEVATRRTGDVVIGADTFVVFQADYLGKVQSSDHARALLQKLSGNQISVFTGLAVLAPAFRYVETVIVRARMKAMEKEAIDSYLASGIYKDKAGAVSLEILETIEGPIDAVLGLPMLQLRGALARAGIELPRTS